MATLIPALGACVSRMTSGERRLAGRLERKVDDDYLPWYDVPAGLQRLHHDFIVLHPSRDLLVLEVKDFRLHTIVQAANGVIHSRQRQRRDQHIQALAVGLHEPSEACG